MLAKLEEADRALRATGRQQLWFNGADPSVLQVAGSCNGFLIEQLLRASGYCDVECVNLLREGVPVVCPLRGSRCFVIFGQVRQCWGSCSGAASG